MISGLLEFWFVILPLYLYRKYPNPNKSEVQSAN